MIAPAPLRLTKLKRPEAIFGGMRPVRRRRARTLSRRSEPPLTTACDAGGGRARVAPGAGPRRPHWLVALVALLPVALPLAAPAAVAHAQQPLVRIPGAVANVTDGAIVIHAGGREFVYVQGFGWLDDIDAPPPTVVDGEVLGSPELLRAFGLEQPVVTGIRFGGDADVRVVVDVPDLDPAALGRLVGGGEVSEGEALRLALPSLVVPQGLPDVYRGLEVLLRQERDGTALEVLGAPFAYEVFALAEPTRLVIDVRPARPYVPPFESLDTVEPLAHGVTYRRMRAMGSGGPTWVHVLEIGPDTGEWRVVGASGEARPTLRLADGAFVAINAGYFDMATREAIGYLVVDGGVLSLPSRGRASIAFGDGAPAIDRVRVDYTVWVNDRLSAISGSAGSEGLAVLTNPGWAGTPRQGVITLDEDGQVLDNRIGPVRLPRGATAVVYPPDNRPLALADEGDAIRWHYRVTPDPFATARYAVEAGPLLLKDGVRALDPAAEAFAQGQRILDGLTQQAALGVRPDGTVLLVAAESMVAADLVDLFTQLGARDALRLDSGGSTTLVAGGRVLNRRSEREVVSAIVWRPHR